MPPAAAAAEGEAAEEIQPSEGLQAPLGRAAVVKLQARQAAQAGLQVAGIPRFPAAMERRELLFLKVRPLRSMAAAVRAALPYMEAKVRGAGPPMELVPKARGVLAAAEVLATQGARNLPVPKAAAVSSQSSINMFYFGKKSQTILLQAAPELQLLGTVAIRVSPWDISCTEAHRGQPAQDLAYAKGASKVQWPDSCHNSEPSRAVHFDPFPLLYPGADLGERENMKRYARYYMLAVHIRQIAEFISVPVRWGGDWDGDWDILDQSFDDLAHWELL